jgi:predicted dithiol-disulfide oxidoreductase (DUF899 family)
VSANDERRKVTRDEWLQARKDLLAREKELTHLREEIAVQRRALPWVAVEKKYVFDTESGPTTLGDAFGLCSQLLVYHFMYPTHWDAGCASCSYWADGYDGIQQHLGARDVRLVAISKAPLAKLVAFRKRMGWSFPWFSSAGNDFNRDFGVSFTQEELTTKANVYNFGTQPFGVEEAPGVSVFAKDADGRIFHTYSCYSRGLDNLNAAYQLLDLVPKGRDEAGLEYPMAWLRLRDKYET